MGQDFKKIAKALSICMPETAEEGEQECFECPFCETCKSDEIVGLPNSLLIAIREYFSLNSYKKHPVQ